LKLPLLLALGIDLEEALQKTLGLELGEVLSTLPHEVVKRYIDNLKQILSRGKLDSALSDEEVAIHIACLVLMGSKRAVYRYSTILSKYFNHAYLANAPEEGLLKYAKLLGLNIIIDNGCRESVVELIDSTRRAIVSCYRYAIPYHQYIEATIRLSKDARWKFVNQYVKGGYVYLKERPRVSRILEEVFMNRLINAMDKLLRDDELRYHLQELGISQLCGDVTEELTPQQVSFENRESTHVQSYDLAIDSLDKLNIYVELFPPCMKRILDRLLNGENLSHQERFALATFLINIGTDLDVVLELFKHSPDFNERIARYQIEHLAGLRGSKKKYLPYSCKTMKVLNLCVSECGVKNPLSYFFKALKEVRRRGASTTS